MLQCSHAICDCCELKADQVAAQAVQLLAVQLLLQKANRMRKSVVTQERNPAISIPKTAPI